MTAVRLQPPPWQHATDHHCPAALDLCKRHQTSRVHREGHKMTSEMGQASVVATGEPRTITQVPRPQYYKNRTKILDHHWAVHIQETLVHFTNSSSGWNEVFFVTCIISVSYMADHKNISHTSIIHHLIFFCLCTRL